MASPSGGAPILSGADTATLGSPDQLSQPVRADTVLPDWLRPYRVAWYSPATPIVIPCLSGQRTPALLADPGRLGLALYIDAAPAVTVKFGVTGFPDGFSVFALSGGQSAQLGLPQLLSLLSADWYCVASADCTVYAVTFARNQ